MKKNQEAYYIGYLPSMPKEFRKWVMPAVIIGILLAVGSAVIVGTSQTPSEASKYELGQLTEIEGVILSDPFPVIRVKVGENEQAKPLYQTLLLMDFGKFGAEETLAELEEMAQDKGGSLAGMRVKASGTLDYREGRVIYELTKGTDAILDMSPLAENEKVGLALERKVLGPRTFKGEILDGKCYFGTMKPGSGKPHRSCAVRCIAGGLPAFLGGLGADAPLLLKGTSGQSINQELLPLVAKEVSVSGELVQYEDWWVLETDMDQLQLVDRTNADWIQECVSYVPQ
ncbi:MAG: hypothetical protein AAGC85_18160 [Bacteroidota bacterium]